MKVRLLPRAQADLLEIEAWLEKEQPVRWKRLRDAVVAGLGQLEKFPLSGPVCREKRLADRGFRVLRLQRFLAFYKVQRATVYVYRLLHQKQSWARLF